MKERDLTPNVRQETAIYIRRRLDTIRKESLVPSRDTTLHLCGQLTELRSLVQAFFIMDFPIGNDTLLRRIDTYLSSLQEKI